MKPIPTSVCWNRPGLLLGTFLLASAGALRAQNFDAGSDGSLGDVVISTNTTLALPPHGKLHYRTLTVNSGARLTFNRNVRNTPVYLLAQGDIVVNGVVDVTGSQANNLEGGQAGPGGFDGGKPGFSTTPPGNGYGPGGGGSGDTGCVECGRQRRIVRHAGWRIALGRDPWQHGFDSSHWRFRRWRHLGLTGRGERRGRRGRPARVQHAHHRGRND